MEDFARRYGPWAVIAGASEGTGASFARKLAAQGINLILVARREGPLSALAEEIRKSFTVECVTGCVDLSQNDGSAKVVALAGDREVGLFINNAGGDPNSAYFLDADLEAWEKLAQLDTMNVMRNCHHFGQRMRERRRGGIILVGSGACYGGITAKAMYCGVKAFDLCFGEGLWAELRGYGVDVLNLVLGQTDTPEHRRVLKELGQPLPTGMAQPDDVADLGLERLPHGPICNWGSADDERGFAPASPADRRARILMIEKMSTAYLPKTA